MNIKKIWMISMIVVISIMGFACDVDQDKEVDKTIIIAEQFGLAYAPIQIMKDQNFLSDQLEGYDIEWVKLGNTAAIREAMLADSLDIGFLGIPPFLIGYENGMDWKVFSGLSSSPLGLVSSDVNINSLSDIKTNDRIALPQPGSIQHILLSMAAEKTFGDAKYFDDQLVTMKHPDGMNALLSDGDVKFHYTSPPYLFEELKEENTQLVIDGATCFGDDFTFIIGVTTQAFQEDEAAFNALNTAMREAIEFINTHREESLDILSQYYDYDRDVLEDYLYHQNIQYTSEVKGMATFVDFMHNNGYLENTYNEEVLEW